MAEKKFYFKDKYWLYVFLLPTVIALLLLTIVPMLYTLQLTFFDWNLITPNSRYQFIGFRNYIDVLTDRTFHNSMWVSFRYSFFSVIGTIVIGMIMALIFFKNLPGSLIVRTLVISAMVISPVIVGTMFRLMLNPGWGFISWLLSLVGIENPGFLAQSHTVLPTLILIDIWQWSPLVMVIVLAALQGLPLDVYEASKVDGANFLQSFLHITLPLLKPSLLLALLIRTMDSLRTFDLIFAMTQGGPGTASQNVNLYMYNVGFEFYRMSRASTMAVILLIVILLISNLIIKLFGGGELYK